MHMVLLEVTYINIGQTKGVAVPEAQNPPSQEGEARLQTKSHKMKLINQKARKTGGT